MQEVDNQYFSIPVNIETNRQGLLLMPISSSVQMPKPALKMAVREVNRGKERTYEQRKLIMNSGSKNYTTNIYDKSVPFDTNIRKESDRAYIMFRRTNKGISLNFISQHHEMREEFEMTETKKQAIKELIQKQSKRTDGRRRNEPSIFRVVEKDGEAANGTSNRGRKAAAAANNSGSESETDAKDGKKGKRDKAAKKKPSSSSGDSGPDDDDYD